MNIAFVGSSEKGYLVSEWCTQNNALLDTYWEKDITRLINPLLSKSYLHIIIDVESLTNIHTEIAECIKKIRDANNASIVIIASGYLPSSDVISSLLNIGVRNFVTAVSLGEMAEQLEKCLSGYYLSNPLEVFPKMEAQNIPTVIDAGRVLNGPITVAFCGSMGRIGTTTQALQAAKFAALQGLKACYIEMNDTGFVQSVADIYLDLQHDRTMGCVKYAGVDLYYNQHKISEILKLGYDCYIYDFGHISIENFNFVSFLEKNIRCVVCGTKPQEIVAMRQVLELLYQEKDIHYLFSFSDPGEQKDVIDMMEDKGAFTHFANYNPDPFIYLSQNNSYFEKVFREVLPKEEEAVVQKPKKRVGLFGRGKN